MTKICCVHNNWSLLFRNAVPVAMNPHGLEPREAVVTVDGGLHPDGSTMKYR
jgi:hypothetical protein